MTTPNPKGSHSLSRRALLKTLIASGSAITLTSLPHRWEKPVVQVGVLPAFAQCSLCVSVTNLTRTLDGGVDNCVLNGLPASSFTVRFDYDDPSGQINDTASIGYRSNISGSPPIFALNHPSITVTGDGFRGTIAMSFCTRFGNNITVSDTITLTNADGVPSNTLTVVTNKPLNASREGQAQQSWR